MPAEYTLSEQVRKVQEEREQFRARLINAGAELRALADRLEAICAVVSDLYPGKSPVDAIATLRYFRERALGYYEKHQVSGECMCEECRMMRTTLEV